jgi:AraC family transcriptional regulator
MRTNLVYLSPVSVVAVRGEGPYSTAATLAWDLMFNWLRTNQILGAISPRYGLLLNDPRVRASSDCRYEACIPLPEDLGQLPWGFRVKRVPYGAYARAPHLGGKVGVARKISRMRTEWTSNIGLVMDTARPVIEIYLDTPFKAPVERQRVDLCLPVMFPTEQFPLQHQSHDPTSGAIR